MVDSTGFIGLNQQIIIIKKEPDSIKFMHDGISVAPMSAGAFFTAKYPKHMTGELKGPKIL